MGEEACNSKYVVFGDDHSPSSPDLSVGPENFVTVTGIASSLRPGRAYCAGVEGAAS